MAGRPLKRARLNSDFQSNLSVAGGGVDLIFVKGKNSGEYSVYDDDESYIGEVLVRGRKVTFSEFGWRKDGTVVLDSTRTAVMLAEAIAEIASALQTGYSWHQAMTEFREVRNNPSFSKPARLSTVRVPVDEDGEGFKSVRFGPYTQKQLLKALGASAGSYHLWEDAIEGIVQGTNDGLQDAGNEHRSYFVVTGDDGFYVLDIEVLS